MSVVTRALYRGCLRAAAKFDHRLAATAGASLEDLGDRCLRANAFVEFLGYFDEDWDWEAALEQNNTLMKHVESSSSAKQAVWEGFRAPSTESDLDDGFQQLVALDQQAEILRVIDIVMAPQQRQSTITYNVGEVLEHPKYGWTCVVLGYDASCKMDEQWMLDNVAPDDAHRLSQFGDAPWYDILCDDGLMRYGSQLTHTRADGAMEFKMSAAEEGKYILDMLFERYDKTNNRYVANRDLALRFPDAEQDSDDDRAQEKPPEGSVCPITDEIMEDPVICSDGHSYDREGIQQWLATNNTSPLTGAELESRNVAPNHALRKVIQEWIARH